MYFGLGLGLGHRHLPVSAASFTPANISNLALWLDSSDTSTITQISGSVSQWRDKSGNAKHAEQATGAQQPVTGTRTLNGMNVIDFATNKNMKSVLGPISQPTSYIFVTGIDTASVNMYLFDGAISRQVFDSELVSGTRKWLLYSGSSVFGASSDTNPHIHVVEFNGATCRHFVDGVLNVSGNAGAGAMQDLVLGARNNNTENLDGFIAEFTMYPKILNNSELNQMGNYLATKWNVTWTTI